MDIVHPFVKRIRLERKVIGLVNKHRNYFGNELVGLSQKAIQTWFDSLPESKRKYEATGWVKEKLESLGRLSGISSNGSHRGAMVAPPPQSEVVMREIDKLKDHLVQLAS